jgi:hypothetical protein
MQNKSYPQNPEEWQSTIQNEIGISKSEGQNFLQESQFPYQKLAHWIQETFKEGFSSDFIPALLRNLQGFVEWVYGEGDEPFWPGSDDESITG